MTETICVLLVEDNHDDTLFFKRAFAKAGLPCVVHSVEDGQMAVEYLLGEGPYGDRSKYPLPSYLFLDLKMPRKSGIELLEWMRGQPELQHLPVAILTSSKEPLDVKRAYELGARTYCIKPVENARLQALVQALHPFMHGGEPIPEPILRSHCLERSAL